MILVYATFFFYWRMENKLVDVLIMKGIFFNVTRPTRLARPTWRKHEVWEKLKKNCKSKMVKS